MMYFAYLCVHFFMFCTQVCIRCFIWISSTHWYVYCVPLPLVFLPHTSVNFPPSHDQHWLDLAFSITPLLPWFLHLLTSDSVQCVPFRIQSLLSPLFSHVSLFALYRWSAICFFITLLSVHPFIFQAFIISTSCYLPSFFCLFAFRMHVLPIPLIRFIPDCSYPLCGSISCLLPPRGYFLTLKKTVLLHMLTACLMLLKLLLYCIKLYFIDKNA